jgi:hypothetical protein
LGLLFLEFDVLSLDFFSLYFVSLSLMPANNREQLLFQTNLGNAEVKHQSLCLKLWTEMRVR